MLGKPKALGDFSLDFDKMDYKFVTRSLSNSELLSKKWELSEVEIASYSNFAGYSPDSLKNIRNLDVISDSLRHPLLDVGWMKFQSKVYTSSTMTNDKSEQNPYSSTLPFSPSILFDYSWYASLIYDQGITMPNDLYGHWLKNGISAGVTVFSKSAGYLGIRKIRATSWSRIFRSNSSWQKICLKLNISEEELIHITELVSDPETKFGIK